VVRFGAVATAADVDKTLKDLVRRLNGAEIDHGAQMPEGSRSLVVAIRDLDITYTCVFANGRIESLKKGQASGDEDARITLSSDDLIALASGKMGIGGALLTGRLRVDAGMRDLLMLRQLF
jgi:putative sterol carrier protein